MSAHRIVARLNALNVAARPVFGAVPAESCGLIAINGWRLSDAIHDFRKACPTKPVIVVLAGSDLYRSKSALDSQKTLRAMSEATVLVVAQSEALATVPEEFRGKCRVIPKSVELPQSPAPPSDPSVLKAIVVSNLRPEKKPLLAARAALALPSDSRIRIDHYGMELDQELTAQAHAATLMQHSRYRWLSSVPHDDIMDAISSADLLINTSIFEGGANAVCEAVALRTPVLATRIPGNVGILGSDYPGLYPAGDAKSLTTLLNRCEQSGEFFDSLKTRCVELAPLFSPEYESRLWVDLVNELIKNQ